MDTDNPLRLMSLATCHLPPVVFQFPHLKCGNALVAGGNILTGSC